MVDRRMGAEQPSPKEAVMESDGRTRSSRRTPLAIGRRSMRRFGHRSRPTQLRTLAAVMAVICGARGLSGCRTGVDARHRRSWCRLEQQPGRQFESSEHLDPRHRRQQDQRRLSGGVAQLASWQGGLRHGLRVRRADQSHQVLRRPGQSEGDPRQEDKPHHRLLRPDERGEHAGPVQGLDGGKSGCLRGDRWCRHLDRHRPAVHHPGGTYPAHQCVEHGDQLAAEGGPLPVVDRCRRCRHPASRRQLGAERGLARVWPQGGDRGRRPVERPDRPQPVPAARPPAGRGDPGGRDAGRRPVRDGRDRRPGPARGPEVQVRRHHRRDPAHSLQRHVPIPECRDVGQLLPEAPALRLRGEHLRLARPYPRSL